MALPAYALVTLDELKRYFPASGDGKNAELEEAIARASQDIEEEGVGGRRLIYRGPVESYTSIVSAGVVVASGALTIVGAPNSAGRTLIVRKNDADRSINSGTLTVSQAAPVLSETFDLTAGDELHGVKFFTAAVTAALSGCSGMNAGDTVDVGTSAGYTEFYSPNGSSEVTPIDWPIQNVVEVNEDLNLLFGSTTALTAATQYVIREPASVRRRIARISNLLDFAFYAGYRVVRARMSAGYRTQAKVPQKIKGVCLELAAWHFQHSEGKQYGFQSVTDGMGSRSFFGPPMLTSGLKNRLAAYLRPEFHCTGERDVDLDAA